MQINVGEYEVFRDGTIVCNENETIDFIFNKEIGFIIRIAFVNDVVNKEPRIDVDKYDKQGAIFTFNNFNNGLGLGNISPITIGTLNNRYLFLNYRIYALDKGGKSLHYTWLLGEEVNNGK